MITFRDHFASLYQSAVEEIAGTATESTLALDRDDLAWAAQRVALRHGSVQPPPSSLEAISAISRAELCASLGWQLMEAKVRGDEVTAARTAGELQAGTCDPRWARTITEYVKYFGPNGGRRPPQYVTPAQAGERVLTIRSGATIGLVSDWGTGAAPARQVLQHLRARQPDILIHLGDIYYSGTETECRDKFEAIVDEVFDRPRSRVPVYTLAGNHDMYCGGVGYYGLIKRLNMGLTDCKGHSLVQPASFFCLRAEDNGWQILAMDTGLHDYSPFDVARVVTFVEQDEQAWLRRRMDEFPGRTILLSHHQLFSAFSAIGAPDAGGRLNPVNPNLLNTFTSLAEPGRIAAWFWGHEHNLSIYQPYSGLERGRCLGHGAVPVFAEDAPYDTLPQLNSPPLLVPGAELSTQGSTYSHGFAIVELGPKTATAEYFECLDAGARSLYRESF